MAGKDATSLDRIDIDILRILQSNGRMPIVELAKLVNLTTTPCSDRVKRLEREGYISGYRAELSAEKLGFEMQAFIHIRLDQTNFSIFERFANEAALMPEVEECYSLSGDFDCMIKIRVRDIKEYQKFMSVKLGLLPGIIQTRSEIVVAEQKRSKGIDPILL